MDPAALQHVLANPALSIGIALALSIPMASIGFALWFWGTKIMRPLCALGCAVIGCLLGLALGQLAGGPWALLCGAIAGIAGGVWFSITLFRFAAAVLCGFTACAASCGLGVSVLLAATTTTTNAQPPSAALTPSPATDVADALKTLLTPPAGAPTSAASGTPSRPATPSLDLAAIAQQAANDAKRNAHAAGGAAATAQSGPPKEYVDVRSLRKGRNELQVESSRDSSGHRKLVIRDRENAQKAASKAAQAAPSQASRPADTSTQTTPDTGQLLEQLRGSGRISDAQMKQLEQAQTLLGNNALGALLSSPGAGMLTNVPDLRWLLAIVAGSGLFGIGVFGLAMWLHRHAVACVSALLGAAMLLTALQLIARAIAGPQLESLTQGLVWSIVSGVLWLAVSATGAWLQLRRDGGILGERPVFAVLGKMPRSRVPQRSHVDQSQDPNAVSAGPLSRLPSGSAASPVAGHSSNNSGTAPGASSADAADARHAA